MTLKGSISKIKTFAVAALATGFFASTASALPVELYQFNLDGTLSQTGGTGGGATLAANGTGTLGAYGYNFGDSLDGLTLTGMSGVSSIYTIAVDFFVDDVDDPGGFFYTKVLDFESSSLAVGDGLYIDDDGALESYANSATAGNFSASSDGIVG